ncbi:hypothetical protein PG994_012934 [Apiospora phragmitis]|uniref:Uncharacterized protein n=1 Tax=Apiospora phragmitis TaxID=2905665 RepID=A0ABR1T777_9PEZI
MSKLTIVIPDRPQSRVLQVQPRLEPTSPADNVNTTAVANGGENEDSNTRRDSDSSSCTCDVLTRLDGHDGGRPALHLLFPVPEERRSAWTRCLENEEMLAFFEFMIVLQMRLLAIAVPTALLFMLVFMWYGNNVD